MKFLTLLSITFLSLNLCGQNQIRLNSGEIHSEIKKAGNTGTALYIAAHPDDENTRLLTWLSRERNIRTGYLSLTRGDGGQNLIGREQGDELGAIRTRELLEARKIDGARQFFTRAVDFGYSKNPEETFTHWNRDSILSDMVWVIRNFRPAVLICRFPATGEGGHGHHTASAILALEAFDAAADPLKFSWQLENTSTWQATRIVWNTFNFGGNNTTSEDQLKIEAGGFNPVLGMSNGEIAAMSRSMHKSQGFGSAHQRGSITEYFKHLKGKPARKDLFDDIDITWNRYNGGEKIHKTFQDLISRYDHLNPSKSIDGLFLLRKQIESLPSGKNFPAHLKEEYLTLLNELILQASGIWTEAVSSEKLITPQQDFNLNIDLVNRSDFDVLLKKVTLSSGQDSTINIKAEKYKPVNLSLQHSKGNSIPYTTPYWLENRVNEGMFDVPLPYLLLADNEPALNAEITIALKGEQVIVKRPVVYRHTDPVKGELYSPLEVLPAATTGFHEKIYIFSGGKSRKISGFIRAHRDDFSGILHLNVPQGWNAQNTEIPVTLKKKGSEFYFETNITPSATALRGSVNAVLVSGADTFNLSLNRINYGHIPANTILSESSAGLVNIELASACQKIGYIPGAGDDIPACLTQAGFDVTILDETMLGSDDLSEYDAIVMGIRAYNTNERLLLYHDRLMDYVKSGRNLIMQYNTNNRISPLSGNVGPYPFTITRNRVTDERSAVHFLNPAHPALKFPNLISEDDFKDWIQERGIYFADDLDANYQTVIAFNDPDEEPQPGSLIIAPYGRGNFVYTGLSFFRELPAGVPGAYRLFVNLLSLPQNQEIHE